MSYYLPLFKIIQRPLLPIADSWVDATPLLLLGLLLIFSLWASRYLTRHQLARRVTQALSFFILIIFLHRCFCALRGWAFGLKLMGRNDIIAFGHICIFLVMATFAVAYGRHFCGWICPLGWLQEGLAVLPARRRQLSPSRRMLAGYLTLAGLAVGMAWLAWLVRPKTQYWSENIAGMWGLGLLVLLGVVLLREARDWGFHKLKYLSALCWAGLAAIGVFVTNPWCTLYGNEVDYSSFVSLLAVVSAGLVVSSAWCRYLCPLGGLLAACSVFARYRIENAAECTKCGQCADLCPTGALRPGEIERSSCIYCGRCVGTCGFYWRDKTAPAPTDLPARACTGRSRSAGTSALTTLLLGLVLLTAPAGTARAQRVVEWPTFHYDNARLGTPPVAFPSADLELLWTYSLGDHTWRYCEGVSVWSASPVVVEVDGRLLVISGAYDHNVYALDAANGEMVWRFTTGCVVNAAPAFARVDGRPLVFVGAGDRCFYCLDARTGQKVWVRETMPWSFTVGESAPTSALVAQVGGEPLVLVGFWNSDRRPGRTIQRGDLYAFRAADGKTVWEQKVTTGQLSSPTAAMVDGRLVIYLGTEEGTVLAFDAATGESLWQVITDHAITNSPTVGVIGGRPAVYVGNFFGMVYCLQGRTGRILWKAKLGHEIRSTAALFWLPGNPVLYLGAYDRCLHALAAKDSRPVWRFQTGKYVSSSPVVVQVGDRPAVIFASQDNGLYMLDARHGTQMWQFQTGDMLWHYETRGASLWSSPVAVHDGKRPLLIFGGHDGKMYCFAGSAAPASMAQHAPPAPGAPAPGAETAAASSPGSPAAVWLPFLLSALLVAAGVAVTLWGPRATDAPSGDTPTG